LTRAVAVLLVVLVSGVELVTCAVFVIEPLPPFPIDVVIVKGAVEPEAREASSQRTVRVALSYVHPGAEVYDRRVGSVSVTTTLCAKSGPLLRATSVQTAVELLRVPFIVRARSALSGGGEHALVADVSSERVDARFCASYASTPNV
jgi:hypothetical protein